VSLIVAAGLAIWQLGFWWGIAIFAVGFGVLTFVLGINLESERLRDEGSAPKRRRTPIAARLHAAALTFLSGVLGFGIAAQIGGGISGDTLGIIAAAATYLVCSVGGEWVLDLNWAGAVGSWCLFMIVWLVTMIPLAAYVAPGYEARGVPANAGMAICVIGAEWLTSIASPWRSRWRNVPE
jgi:hypothetical protein